MEIVVDTNIVFSALLNSRGAIGDLIFNSHKVLEFYSCSFMQQEIQNHWEKLKKISKLSDEQLQVSYHKILLNIRFINEELIPQKTWFEAEQLVKEVDIDDTDFVAWTKHLKGRLWTGDKELYAGLIAVGFKKIFDARQLLSFRTAKLKESEVK